MHISHVRQMLEIIGKVYGKRNIDILDESEFPYHRVLPEAIKHAELTWRNFRNDSKKYPIWGYEISDSQPLSFKPSEVLNGARVDIYCDIKWADGDVPAKQDIKIRVWSEDGSIAYREEFDAEHILSQLTDKNRLHKGRVISRFHFDRADHSQGKSNEYHPEYHLQVGGIAREYELCWHPHSFDIPRLAHHPMELFLTCQLVATNFFPTKYIDISREFVWRNQLLWYQKAIWLAYYEKCLRAISDGQPLLDTLRSG